MTAPALPPGLAGQIACLLRAPWQWRRNDGLLWALGFYGLVLVPLLVLPALAALVWLPTPAAWAAVAGLAGLGLLLLWGLQFGALLRLDHPHAARLVPGHPRALRRTALGLWAGLATLAGAATALGAALLDRPAAAFGLGAGLALATAMLFVALAVRWWWTWLLLSLAGSLASWQPWRAVLAAAWHSLQMAWLAQPLVLAATAVLLQGLLLCNLFGAGDDRHVRTHARRERMRQIMQAGATGQKPTLAAYGRWGEWLGAPVQRLADAWLARVCRQARPQPASAMARAEIVLHGAQHWVRHLVGVVLAQGILLVSLAVVVHTTGVAPSMFIQHGQIGIAIGVASLALTAVNLRGALWLSRREQALLVLLPGMPPGRALNRHLAWCQLRHALLLWAALLPVLLVVAWVGALLPVLAFLGMVPLLSVWMLRDPARLRPPSPSGALLPMALCLAGGLASQMLLRAAPWALLPWALALLGLTAGLLAWQWRRLQWLPPALPAGRLG
jgi:hypothetical protein